jgi:membrane fusion protein (multidrug efflux system)
MKRNRIFIFILIILALLAVIKYFFLNKESNQPQAIKPGSGMINAEGFIATEGKIDNNLLITGTAFANEEAQLMPEISGKLNYLNIPEGKIITKGSLVAKINDSELQAQLRKIQSELILTREKENRNKKLLDINSISKEEYESSLNELQVKKSEIELIQTQIQKTQIRAPFTGMMGFKTVSPGSYISTSQSIASIQQLDPIKIEFSIPEKYRNMIQPGGSIRFTTDSRKDTLLAKIQLIEPRIDPETRTIKVRALYPNKNISLLPGAFVKIQMALKEKNNAIMIPTEALIPILKGYKVFVLKNTQATEMAVETGVRTATEIEVTNGIHTGDTIITSGLMMMKAGSRVNITSIRK